MYLKLAQNKLLNKFVLLAIILLQVNRNSFANGLTASTPYPDANAKPTITTKLENLSDLHKSSISTTTTSTEGYPNIFNENDKYGKILNTFDKIKIHFTVFYEIFISIDSYLHTTCHL